METQTLTLTDFLLARLTADEADAWAATIMWRDSEMSEAVRHHGPVRVLAEVEAKRRIVAEHVGDPLPYGAPECAVCTAGDVWEGDSGTHIEMESMPCHTLRHLASVYADHPDYRAEWRA